jgi:hypothetical protein
MECQLRYQINNSAQLPPERPVTSALGKCRSCPRESPATRISHSGRNSSRDGYRTPQSQEEMGPAKNEYQRLSNVTAAEHEKKGKSAKKQVYRLSSNERRKQVRKNESTQKN